MLKKLTSLGKSHGDAVARKASVTALRSSFAKISPVSVSDGTEPSGKRMSMGRWTTGLVLMLTVSVSVIGPHAEAATRPDPVAALKR
ncbi:hypothetical protein [Nonomuraea angiospora]